MTDRAGPADTPPAETTLAAHEKDPLRSSSTSHVWLSLAALAVLLILLVVFLVQNTTKVPLHLFGWTWHPPLAAALIAAVAAGLLLAVIAGSLRIVQLRRRVHREARRSRQTTTSS